LLRWSSNIAFRATGIGRAQASPADPNWFAINGLASSTSSACRNTARGAMRVLSASVESSRFSRSAGSATRLILSFLSDSIYSSNACPFNFAMPLRSIPFNSRSRHERHDVVGPAFVRPPVANIPACRTGVAPGLRNWFTGEPYDVSQVTIPGLGFDWEMLRDVPYSAEWFSTVRLWALRPRLFLPAVEGGSPCPI
jgi:hypothetical protein